MNPIKAYLEKHNLTGDEFARDAGLKQYEISRLVKGRRKASVRIAKAIEEATAGQITREQLRPDVFADLTEAAQ